MRYLNKVLQPGETIVHRGRIHWITHLRGLLVVLAGVIVLVDAHGPHWASSIAEPVEQTVSYVLLALGAAMLVRSRFRQWTTEIAVTDRRVIQKSGFISRHTAEMNINQVERVEVIQTILGRLLNYGSIRIHGSGMGMEGLEDVAEPLTLRTCITAR